MDPSVRAPALARGSYSGFRPAGALAVPRAFPWGSTYIDQTPAGGKG
jgi:hypothetical protein